MKLDWFTKHRLLVCATLAYAAWIAICAVLYYGQKQTLDAIYTAYAQAGAPNLRYGTHTIYAEPLHLEKQTLETWSQAHPYPADMPDEVRREFAMREVQQNNAAVDTWTILHAQQQAQHGLYLVLSKMAVFPLFVLFFYAPYFFTPTSSVHTVGKRRGYCPRCEYHFPPAELKKKARKVSTFNCPSCHARLIRHYQMLPGEILAKAITLFVLMGWPWRSYYPLLFLFIISFAALMNRFSTHVTYLAVAKPLHDLPEPEKEELAHDLEKLADDDSPPVASASPHPTMLPINGTR
ncbi:MAG: hypothetical protein ACYC26_17360 [Phycisphaerales bacterium]